MRKFFILLSAFALLLIGFSFYFLNHYYVSKLQNEQEITKNNTTLINRFFYQQLEKFLLPSVSFSSHSYVLFLPSSCDTICQNSEKALTRYIHQHHLSVSTDTIKTQEWKKLNNSSFSQINKKWINDLSKVSSVEKPLVLQNLAQSSQAIASHKSLFPVIKSLMNATSLNEPSIVELIAWNESLHRSSLQTPIPYVPILIHFIKGREIQRFTVSRKGGKILESL